MPRVPISLLLKARRQSSLLPLLVRECRDLESSRNELRWLAEDAKKYVRTKYGQQGAVKTLSRDARAERFWQILSANVLRRSRGEPLQYILGTTPFGDLEILCRSGVLIPRWETEVYTEKMGVILNKISYNGSCTARGTIDNRNGLRILDLCTGSGCIALLLHSLLANSLYTKQRIIGVDVSSTALELAKENLKYNIQRRNLQSSATEDISFRHLDVLALASKLGQPGSTTEIGEDIIRSHLREFFNNSDPSPECELVISNPPYISSKQYSPGGPTARSVRKYEPKLALVAPDSSDGDHGDEFYPAILNIAKAVKAKCIVMEVGDGEQATRVARMSQRSERARVEIWDDDGNVRIYSPDDGVESSNLSTPAAAPSPSERAVVVWRKEWIEWRERNPDLK